MPQNTNSKMLERADATLADMARDGGTLTDAQADKFIDYITETPSMYTSARVIRMRAPRERVNRIGFKERILRAARQVGSANDGGGNDRYVRQRDRSKPTTSQIELDTAEVIAEVRLPYEMFEDNIEGRNLEQVILRGMASRAALDLEEAALWSHPDSTDAYLALQTGWMARSENGGHVMDWNNGGVNPDLFAESLKSLPQAYLRYLPQMRAYISNANRISYSQLLTSRHTNLGDQAISASPLASINAHGLTLATADTLAAQENGQGGLITFPQNLLVGIRRDMTMEMERDIKAREFVIVLTMRVGYQIEDIDAVVRLRNIGGLNERDRQVPVFVTNAADMRA